MVHKILIIRFRRIGDSVLATALCRSLKESFPQAEIHFIINENISPLYLNHPDIDKVITFSDKENHGFNYIKKVWNIVHETDYDVIIDMRSTIKTLPFPYSHYTQNTELAVIKNITPFYITTE